MTSRAFEALQRPVTMIKISRKLVSDGMDAPTYTASKCAKVEMQINHLNRQERPT